MNIKAIITSTLLTIAVTGTLANAGDNNYLSTPVVNNAAEPFVIKHAYLLTTEVEVIDTEEAMSK